MCIHEEQQQKKQPARYIPISLGSTIHSVNFEMQHRADDQTKLVHNDIYTIIGDHKNWPKYRPESDYRYAMRNNLLVSRLIVPLAIPKDLNKINSKKTTLSVVCGSDVLMSHHFKTTF